MKSLNGKIKLKCLTFPGLAFILENLHYDPQSAQKIALINIILFRSKGQFRVEEKCINGKHEISLTSSLMFHCYYFPLYFQCQKKKNAGK